MKNRSKKLLFTLLLSLSVVMVATGCDKLKKAPETESETEPPTEKVTESETEPPTEKVTEPPTEKETEPPTESETEPKILTAEEELAQETEFDQYRTLYAADDINVRTQPGTGDDIDIFESFDQGERIIAVGETPNWYVVQLDDYEENGYVSKQFVSTDEVEPKSEEERAQLNATATTGSTDGETSTGSSTTGSSSVDAEYSVEAYAESFPIQATAGANMRQTPSQDGEIIQTIASGTSVTAVGYTDRWYKIEYDGNVGYVNKNLFSAD